MAISAPGVGSGLDVESIVSKLVALERRPIQQLQTQKSSLQTKLSQWGQIKSALSALQDAANRLRDPGLWNTRTATVTGNGVSASTGAGATSGSFNVSVSQLATAQNVRTNATLGVASLGWEGRLQITGGQWDTGGNFTPGSASPIDINVSATDTLTDIARKINDAGAGVTATVVNTGSGQRLAIRSNDTGEANGFEIRTFDSNDDEIFDDTGLGNLRFASGGTSGLTGSLGTNAELEIDGIPVTSASNTVANAINGVTLTLSATTSTPAQVSIGNDTKAYRDAIENFQRAYNSLNTLLRNATRADSTGNGSNGPLIGDQAAIGIQRALRNALGNNGPGGLPFNRLSDIGMEVMRDGSLNITSSSKLNNALNDPASLRTFFDDGTAGIATQVRNITSRLLSFDGTVNTRSQGLQDSIKRQDRQIERQEDRITRVEAQLRAQYSRLDTTLSGLTGLNAFLSQQISQWNRPV
jgi:flagellar hook-associated protein 2